MSTITLWHGTTGSAARMIAEQGILRAASDVGASRDKYAKPRVGRVYLTRSRVDAEEYASERISAIENDEYECGIVQVEVPIDQLQPDEDTLLAWLTIDSDASARAMGGDHYVVGYKLAAQAREILDKAHFEPGEPEHRRDHMNYYKKMLSALEDHPIMAKMTAVSKHLSAPAPLKVKKVIVAPCGMFDDPDEIRELPIGMKNHSAKMESTGTPAIALPIIRKSIVYHVGALDGPRQIVGGTGMEGDGLSVSEHPDAWRQIAQLGGHDTWILKKSKAVFVNALRALKNNEIKAALMQWGIQRGLLAPTTLWRLFWYDDEQDNTMYQDFTSRKKAESEAKSLDEFDIKEIPGGFEPTLAFEAWYKNISGGRELSLVMIDDMVLFRYAEDASAYDGVWWNETLDAPRHSAPRGSIFQDKLNSWGKRKATDDELEDLVEHGCVISELVVNGSQRAIGHIAAFRGHVWTAATADDYTEEQRVDICRSILKEHPNLKQSFKNHLAEYIDNPEDMDDDEEFFRYIQTHIVDFAHFTWNAKNRILSLQHNVNIVPESSPLVKKVAKLMKARAVTTTGIYRDKEPDNDGRDISTSVKKLVGDVPSIVYHGTCTKYLFRILTIGLNPGEKDTNHPGTHHPDKVFFAASLELAKTHASSTATKQNAGQVVVEIRIPDRAELLPDYDADYNSTKHTYDHTARREPFERSSVGPMGTSKHTGAFGYVGRIPVSAILAIHWFNGNRWIRTTKLADLRKKIDNFGWEEVLPY